MENKNTVTGKIKRKKFFASAGISLLGAALFSQFPLNLFGKTEKNNITKENIKVEINPFAVNRKKTGGKHA